MTVPCRPMVLAMWVALAALLPLAPTAWAGASLPAEKTTEQRLWWRLPVPGQQPYVGQGAAADVVAEVNRRRAEAGCRSVRLPVSLTRAAQAHSADMAAHQRLDHTGSDGSRPQERLRAAGYRADHSGEAVASAPVTAGAVVESWMASRPHRNMILTCHYRDAGVGRADGSGGPWWTLELATRR